MLVNQLLNNAGKICDIVFLRLSYKKERRQMTYL